jgi:hypothetical protein
MKRKSKTAIIIIVCIIFIAVVQTLPVFFPKPLGSMSIVNDNICLYYQSGDEKGAKEVFELLNNKSEEIYAKMGFENSTTTEVYLYKTQWQLAIREAGFITLIVAPPWHIGDSHNGNIMMVSPYAPVKVHSHDSILAATLHELVHSIVYQVNPNLSYFWDNGLATYLSEQKPEETEIESMPVPSLEDMHTENGLKFGEMGGYAFSYKYIEYLNQTYGWEKIMGYASGKGSYEEIFNHTEEEIYNEWCSYIKK